jgi:hypothetical protein
MTAPLTPEPMPEPTAEQQTAFNALFENAVAAYVEKNKPAPPKTDGRPGGIMDWLLGTGQKAE